MTSNKGEKRQAIEKGERKSQKSFQTRAPLDLHSPKEMENDFTFSSKSYPSTACWNPGDGECISLVII